MLRLEPGMSGMLRPGMRVPRYELGMLGPGVLGPEMMRLEMAPPCQPDRSPDAKPTVIFPPRPEVNYTSSHLIRGLQGSNKVLCKFGILLVRR